ncbi:MAG: radical SAM protein [Deltaproteobacteria bacterium]|jgi:radical SAM superfamily enzyme YgiQ (UPF0313 family)|nr:radical SAM protein [Deltaproteobacteria bacterium]MBT6432312.1 radical SAM protein [Deltaproteobacteria bacterium]MBT6492076.1 radical SAM protein [Deltaproteobacteria bacterium]
MTKPHVLALNPPSSSALFRDHYCSSEAKSTYLWQPLDLQIQALWLRDHGIQTSALDAIAQGLSQEATLKQIEELKPTHVLMLTSTRSWPSDKIICEAIRKMGVLRIIGTGDFLRFRTRYFEEARQWMDWILTDFAVDGLAQSILNDIPVEPALTSFDGDIHACAKRLRSLPLDYPKSQKPVFAFKDYRLPYPGFHTTASVLTSFGCTYHCKFCHVGELGYKLRDPERILQDFEAASLAGAASVYVRDAMINGNIEHACAWMEKLVAANLKIPWAAFMTAKPAPEKLIALAAKSGCKHVQIGVETLSQTLRKDNGKAISNAHNIRVIELCHRYGIEVTAHLVLGLPGETEETLSETYANIHRFNFDYVALNLAEHRPGIPWDKQNQVLPVTPGEPTGPHIEELKVWQRKMYRRFYMRPSRLIREGVTRLKTGDLGDVVGLTGSVMGWLKS